MNEAAGMAKESSRGQMAPSTKASGRLTNGTIQAESYTPMATSTTESGKIIRRTGMASLAMLK